MRICIPRPDRPKADRPQFVQPTPGAARPDPRAGRWASVRQAADLIGGRVAHLRYLAEIGAVRSSLAFGHLMIDLNDSERIFRLAISERAELGAALPNPAQAAEVAGLSRGAVAEAVARHPHLAVRVDPPPAAGAGGSTLARPVVLVDPDRLGRAIERGG